MSRPDIRNVTVFAPADVHSLEISGIMDALHEANRYGGRSLYDVCVVAESSEPIRCASGLQIVPDRTIYNTSSPCDTFVVTGSYGVPATPSEPVVG